MGKTNCCKWVWNCSKKANLQFYKDNKIKNIGLTSPHSVTIPGAVHAWCSMHEKFGRIDFKEVLMVQKILLEKDFLFMKLKLLHGKRMKKT